MAYADSRGWRLLDMLARHGWLFTANDAVTAGTELALSRPHVYKLLSELAAGGRIRRLKGGLYAFEPPLGGRGGPHTFAIATHLVMPSAISHWSALHYWDLIDQVPLAVTASTPKNVVTPDVRGTPEGRDRRGHGAWVVDGVRYEFVHIPEQHMFGIEQVWVDAETRVPIFDRERTVLDAFVQVSRFGAGHFGEMLVTTQGDRLDPQRLLAYAAQIESPRVLQRVERALELAGRQPADAGLAP